MLPEDPQGKDTSFEGVTEKFGQLSEQDQQIVAKIINAYLVKGDDGSPTMQELKGAEDIARRNGQIVALTRATLEEFSLSEMFGLFGEMDAEAQGRIGLVHKTLTSNPASSEEPKPWDDQLDDKQLLAYLRKTVTGLKPATLFWLFSEMDAEAQERVGFAFRSATYKPSESEEPKPWDKQHYEDYMDSIEALAMRIVGDLAAGEYMLRGSLFDTWDSVVKVVQASLLKGSLSAKVAYIPFAPSGFTSWLDGVNNLRRKYESAE